MVDTYPNAPSRQHRIYGNRYRIALYRYSEAGWKC